MAFLHGVEVIELSSGARPVNVVISAVILLVSIAPQGVPNELLLVQSENDAAQFGFEHPDNLMRKAISRIFAQGSATIVCVNVFSEADHVEAVSAESQTVAGGRVKLARLFYDNLVVKEGVDTLVLDTDYSYDTATQVLTIINTTDYPDGTVLAIDYDAVTDTLTDVADADIIGTVSGSTRTGLQLIDECYSQFGFVPRILISPYFSTRAAVAAELIEKAEAVKAHAILDAVKGATPAEVLSGRGSTAGTVKNFYTSSKRAILSYLWVNASQPYTSEVEAEPMSPFVAGAMSNKDNTQGFWVSASNTELRGVLGLERVLTFNPSDTNTETNLLNGAGVTTIASWYGSGYRLWGNRSAAFPTNTEPSNFVCVQRTADIIHDSLVQASLQFIDKPLNAALIDDIRATGNAFMRTLIQRGALIDGEVTYNPADNPEVELAAGHVTFRINFMPPTPAERITFLSLIDTSLLATLNA